MLQTSEWTLRSGRFLMSLLSLRVFLGSLVCLAWIQGSQSFFEILMFSIICVSLNKSFRIISLSLSLLMCPSLLCHRLNSVSAFDTLQVYMDEQVVIFQFKFKRLPKSSTLLMIWSFLFMWVSFGCAKIDNPDFRSRLRDTRFTAASLEYNTSSRVMSNPKSVLRWIVPIFVA